MKFGLYFCECGESYVSDFPFNSAMCVECGSALERQDKPTSAQLSSLVDKQLAHIWKFFCQVPYDSEDGITEPFLIWLPTTNRFAIWLWFAKRYSGTFADLPGKLVFQEEGRAAQNECECGVTIGAGTECYFNQTQRKVLCSSCGKKEQLDIWLFEGYRNPWIISANDPPFDRNSFTRCESIDELIEKFRQGNWNLGKAFVYRNLAFVNQTDGADEWMVIKDWCSFESTSMVNIVRKYGDAYARKYIRELLRYHIDDRKGPDYTIVEALI